MEIFCFLILHYNNIAETKKCVDSIKSLDHQKAIRIMIVDNGSPNGTGKKLQEDFIDDNQISVLLLDQNLGFSAGNNTGCLEALHLWNYDYLVVANNDIIFNQKNFIEKIQKKYTQYCFDILGSDIYNPYQGTHQSPISCSLPSHTALMKTIVFNFAAILTLPLTYHLLRNYYQKARKLQKATPFYDRDFSDINLVLQGSCLIFSKKYIMLKLKECENKLFYPETHFYYEEYLQTLWCKKNHQLIIYSPELQVIHMHGKSTDTSYHNEKANYHFRLQNIMKSAIVYLKFEKKLH